MIIFGTINSDNLYIHNDIIMQFAIDTILFISYFQEFKFVLNTNDQMTVYVCESRVYQFYSVDIILLLYRIANFTKKRHLEFRLLFLSNFTPCISVKLQYCRKYAIL